MSTSLLNKKSKDEILEFNAIPLWEVLLSFFVILVLILTVTECIIIPLTKKNSMMQTQLIVLMGIIFLFIEFIFHKKRGRKILIKTSKESISSIELPKIELHVKDIKNLCVVKFIFEKSLSYTFIVNNEIFFIYKKTVLSLKPNKKNIKDARSENRLLLKLVQKVDLCTNNYLKFIPICINMSFYLLFITVFLLVLFISITIATNNTQWFNYFR